MLPVEGVFFISYYHIWKYNNMNNKKIMINASLLSVVALLVIVPLTTTAYATNSNTWKWADASQTYVCTTDLQNGLTVTGNVSICPDTATSEARWENNPGSNWSLSTSGTGNDTNVTAEDLAAGIYGNTFTYKNYNFTLLVDAYMELNENTSWGDAIDGDSSEFDFQSVMTHEFGHLAGLSHTTNTSSVMYAAIVAGDDNRQPTSHDYNHMDDKY